MEFLPRARSRGSSNDINNAKKEDIRVEFPRGGTLKVQRIHKI